MSPERRLYRGRFVPYILGTLLLGLAGVMVVLAGYAALASEPSLGFALAAVTAGALGLVVRRFGSSASDPSRREALVTVLLAWIVLPLVGALPFCLSGSMSPLNAFFESMSGFSGTGATTLMDFASFGRSLFLWRAFTQWIGGIGILVIFIAVFPQLAIAGRQLFFTEATGPTEERVTPRLRNTAAAVAGIYATLTAVCVAAYVLAGLPVYESVAHALTTLSAGGFSPHPLSFVGYDDAQAEWVCIAFMFLAGANFALLYRVATGRLRAITRDAEFRAYVAIVLLAAGFLALLRWGDGNPAGTTREALFQALSIVSTTGFASTDFAAWGAPAQAVLVSLMFVGGSSRSAGGGVKVARWLILAKNTAREVRRALHPRAVLPVRVGGRVIPEGVLRAVAAFITLYVTVFAASTFALVLLGSDFTTAFTAAIACLGNVGPGLAEVGPLSSYAGLHPLSRVVLIFDMYAGRLEVVTLFIVFTAGFWRSPRRSPARSTARRR